MTAAIASATHAKSLGDYPVAAVLAWAGGKTITEHDTRYTDRNPLNYAIINVINKASDTLGRKRLSEAVLYTTVEPNLMCLLAIQEAGIKEVVFGVYDDRDGYKSSRVLSEDVVLDVTAIGGMLGSRCGEILPESVREHIRYE
jgi:tRNA(Arg) A34 adenosine deaminase TadA